MSAATPEPQPLLRPAEAAKRLCCSEWWLKEQARRGRIPYTRIGGGYRFTEEHITAIVRIFEVHPAGLSAPIPAAAASQATGEPQSMSAPVIQLRARLPKRARVMDQQQAA